MHPICSCGTELPEGARFCFRCGKPQREEDVERFTPPAVTIVPPPIPSAASEALYKVSFGNPAALRTALFVACLITALEIYPPLLILAPLSGGFAAVMLFQKRTGRILTTGAAAKLGWMTAVLNTTLGTIAVTVTALLQGFEPLRQAFREQATSPSQQQALQMMNDPWVLAGAVLMSWIFVFLLISGLCIAGGALGARLARPRIS